VGAERTKGNHEETQAGQIKHISLSEMSVFDKRNIASEASDVNAGVPGFDFADYEKELLFHPRNADVPKHVWVGMFLVGISEIKNVEQTIKVTFQLNIEWVPSFGDFKKWLENPREFEPESQPRLKFFDVVEIVEKQPEIYGHGYDVAFYQLEGDEGPLAIMQKATICTMVFQQCFSLRAFPFDTQKFEVRMYPFYEFYGEQVLALPRVREDGCLGTSLMKQELSTWSITSVNVMPLKLGALHGLSFQIFASRKWEYYVSHLVLTDLIIAAFSFFVFPMDAADDFDARVSLLVTLLLTAVAFQLVVSSFLPPLPYWTLMDWNVQATLWFILLITIFCALARIDPDNDELFFILSLCIFTGYNVFFAGICAFTNSVTKCQLPRFSNLCVVGTAGGLSLPAPEVEIAAASRNTNFIDSFKTAQHAPLSV